MKDSLKTHTRQTGVRWCHLKAKPLPLYIKPVCKHCSPTVVLPTSHYRFSVDAHLEVMSRGKIKRDVHRPKPSFSFACVMHGWKSSTCNMPWLKIQRANAWIPIVSLCISAPTVITWEWESSPSSDLPHKLWDNNSPLHRHKLHSDELTTVPCLSSGILVVITRSLNIKVQQVISQTERTCNRRVGGLASPPISIVGCRTTYTPPPIPPQPEPCY